VPHFLVCGASGGMQLHRLEAERARVRVCVRGDGLRQAAGTSHSRARTFSSACCAATWRRPAAREHHDWGGHFQHSRGPRALPVAGECEADELVEGTEGYGGAGAARARHGCPATRKSEQCVSAQGVSSTSPTARCVVLDSFSSHLQTERRVFAHSPRISVCNATSRHRSAKWHVCSRNRRSCIRYEVTQASYANEDLCTS